MRFTIPSDVLKEALEKVAPIVNAGSTIPILTNQMIRAKDGRIEFHGTDLDIAAVAVVEGQVDAEGGTTVSSKLLAAFSKMARGDVVFEIIENLLHLSAKGRMVELPTLPVEDFPAFKFDAGKALGGVEILAEALEFASVSASSEETRYYLNGVCLSGVDAVATDGHKLSKWTYPSDVSAILPRTMLPHIIKALKLDGAEFRLAETKWLVAADGFTLGGKVVDGTFPDYARVIPAETRVIFTAYRDELVEAVFDATLKQRGAVRIEWPEEDQIDGEEIVNISSRGIRKEGGFEGHATAECAIIGPAELFDPVAINSRYLIECLKSLPEGEIQFHANSSGTYKITSEKAPDCVCVIMGMRV